ncbi:serine protease 27-like [Prorops nasuta]|uniref:serine protease 27-like n=1 Tax=Prorops nasuta TaxID=863751 RepID=UPI0034CD0875
MSALYNYIVYIILLVLIQSSNIAASESENIQIEVSNATLVSVNSNNQHICTGTLFAPNLLITSASCVCNNTTKNLTITASIKRSDNEEKVYQVQQVFCHPSLYISSKSEIADIAVISLEEFITIITEQRVAVILLSSNLLPKTNCYFLGFHENSNETVPNVESQKQVEIMSTDNCRKIITDDPKKTHNPVTVDSFIACSISKLQNKFKIKGAPLFCRGRFYAIFDEVIQNGKEKIITVIKIQEMLEFLTKIGQAYGWELSDKTFESLFTPRLG